jgi:GNAT superfamily N-acetyltransferase
LKTLRKIILSNITVPLQCECLANQHGYWVKNFLKKSKKALTFVVVHSKVICMEVDMASYTDEEKGWVSWDITSDTLLDSEGYGYEGEAYALIAHVWTAPESRGQGIARQNVIAAMDEIRAEHGGISIRLWCEPQDKDTDSDLLMSFYESLGFEATGSGSEMVCA